MKLKALSQEHSSPTAIAIETKPAMTEGFFAQVVKLHAEGGALPEMKLEQRHNLLVLSSTRGWQSFDISLNEKIALEELLNRAEQHYAVTPQGKRELAQNELKDTVLQSVADMLAVPIK
jgi:hypothetical protein